MVTLYGIKNCDTMKKALAWLDAQGVAHRLHDYRQAGLECATLEAWEAELGWEALLNRRGTTWRRLPEETRATIDRENALRLMLETPTLIRRPLLDTGATRHVGFDPAQYRRLFG